MVRVVQLQHRLVAVHFAYDAIGFETHCGVGRRCAPCGLLLGGGGGPLIFPFSVRDKNGIHVEYTVKTTRDLVCRSQDRGGEIRSNGTARRREKYLYFFFYINPLDRFKKKNRFSIPDNVRQNGFEGGPVERSGCKCNSGVIKSRSLIAYRSLSSRSPLSRFSRSTRRRQSSGGRRPRRFSRYTAVRACVRACPVAVSEISRHHDGTIFFSIPPSRLCGGQIKILLLFYTNRIN